MTGADQSVPSQKLPNNSMQRTALRAAADAGRSAAGMDTRGQGLQ